MITKVYFYLQISEQVLCLPLYAELEDENIEKNSKIINE